MFLAMNTFLGIAAILISLIVFFSIAPIYRCKRCGKRHNFQGGLYKLCKSCWEATGGPQKAAEIEREYEIKLSKQKEEEQRQKEEREKLIQSKLKLAEERRSKRKQALWYRVLLRVLLCVLFLFVILILTSIILAWLYRPQALHYFGVASVLYVISIVAFIELAFGDLDRKIPVGEGMACIISFGGFIYATYNLVLAFSELLKSL